jgi:saccharopine dehydrogenase (NAD+, L-lysine-forming)
MQKNTVLILGGYGNAGFEIAHWLLKMTKASKTNIILAGRSQERAFITAGQLNATHMGDDWEYRVTSRRVNAADFDSVKSACEQADLVIVAASAARHAETIARAALAAGCDYLDIQYSSAKMAALRALEPDIRRAGRCFITDGGFHPGVPGALARYAASQFDLVERIAIGGLMRLDWSERMLGDSTLAEFIEEIARYRAEYYRDGAWKTAGIFGGWRKFDFGAPFGKHRCMAMGLEEIWRLPELYPNLRECGFYMAGFDAVTDYLALPLAWLVMQFRGTCPRWLGVLLQASLSRFSRPPYRTLLQLVAQGEKAGKRQELELSLSHPDAYALTAIPVVACFLQYLQGYRPAGLFLQAHYVAPAQFIRDMQSMGVTLNQYWRAAS